MKKRRILFRFLRSQNYDIVCLQEAHIMDKDSEQWQKEWGGGLYHVSETAKSGGQIILLRKGIQSIVEVKQMYFNPRILTVNLKIDEKELLIFSVYAPNINNEKLDFLQEMNTIIKNNAIDYTLICGDFNAVLDNELDIISGEKYAEGVVNKFNSLLSECDLFDAWRLFNIESKEFTWSRNTPFIARRLDYVLASSLAFDKILSCHIDTVPMTDHRACVVKLKFSNIVKGPSYYKFNNSLLNDINFVHEMNDLIDNFDEENNNSQMAWELLKIKIREFSICYSKTKSLEKKNEIALLRVKLNDLDVLLGQAPDSEDALRERNKIKSQLEIAEHATARAAQIRSRVKWVAEGEKNTKYFLSLEKANANSRIIDSLQNLEGVTVSSQEEILNVQKKYFENLYKKKVNDSNMINNINDFMDGVPIPKISETEQEFCDENISENELLIALKEMKNGTSPGIDGLTVEFYKVFWNHLRNYLLNSFVTAFESGTLSSSQNKAVITLIHKGKNLPRNNLDNWRPISLTNTDYKILAKTLSMRLNSVISKLISEDQVGYIKGRKVATLLRTIDDVTDVINKENRPGILLTIDMFHAFDCISKEYMLEVFKTFGFGDTFTHWVSVLMSGSMSVVNYCGWMSESIAVESGIRQGCCFSPLAFVLALELLAIKIRNSPNIKGITLSKKIQPIVETIVKILLYADDITLLLSDVNDMTNVLSIFSDFSKLTGLKINYKKSEAMWLGSLKTNIDRPFGFTWKNNIKILGIYFSNVVCASQIAENWTNRLDVCKRLIATWEKRNLSIMGKIVVAKTFLVSQWIYVMQVLLIPEKVITEVNRLLYRFVWRKKDANKKAFEKVKRVVLCSEIDKGGLNMLDLKTFQTACLLKWAVQLCNQSCSERWKEVAEYCFSIFSNVALCFLANTRSKDFKGFEHIQSYFWSNVVRAWLDNNSITENSLYFGVWNNTKIKCQGKVLFFPRWIKANVIYISDLINPNGNILEYEEIVNVIGQSASSWLEYRAVHEAVRNFLSTLDEPFQQRNICTTFLMFKGKKVTSIKHFRQELICEKYSNPCCTGFWKRKLNYDVTPPTWLTATECTKETRLRLLHWKIIHNIYPTNILLQKMKVTDSNHCSLCTNCVDFIEHFFYECPPVKKFWHCIEVYINKTLDIVFKLDVNYVLFGVSQCKLSNEFKRKLNYIILLAKMCVSIFKKTGSKVPLLDIFDYQVLLREEASFLKDD